MTQHIIVGNYGDNTIALLQWAHEYPLKNVTVVSVDTGWAAVQWDERIRLGSAFAKRLGCHVIRLTCAVDFAGLVRDRKRFPNPKFQWCTSMLKGLPLNDWLDETDIAGEAIILLGKQRAASRANKQLAEFVFDSEYYGGRQVWHPILDGSLQERDELIKRAGFSILGHRSLECDPCIHNNAADFSRLSAEDRLKMQALEQNIGQSMFDATQSRQNAAEDYNDDFARGCGSPWGCGL